MPGLLNKLGEDNPRTIPAHRILRVYGGFNQNGAESPSPEDKKDSGGVLTVIGGGEDILPHSFAQLGVDLMGHTDDNMEWQGGGIDRARPDYRIGRLNAGLGSLISRSDESGGRQRVENHKGQVRLESRQSILAPDQQTLWATGSGPIPI
uniref:Uncharacterized protein n=1 Tax=Amphimedon queenslandica TaxID=400682 RepID=A0A1X7U512_AMPQE